MSKPIRRLTRAQIVRALTRLGELCAAAAIKAEIAIYGGTVMMIAYDCRTATKDVDAVFHPVGVIEPLIRQVAVELKLPEDWMNSGVKTFVGAREAPEKSFRIRNSGARADSSVRGVSAGDEMFGGAVADALSHR